jgi:hypothetical protein
VQADAAVRAGDEDGLAAHRDSWAVGHVSS